MLTDFNSIGPYYIYLILMENDVWYIGKGSTNRVLESMKERNGLAYSILESNIVDQEEAYSSEVEWISSFRAAGIKLANVTDGGSGGYGYKFTTEQLLTLSEKTTEFWNSPEGIAIATNRNNDPDVLEKNRLAQLGNTRAKGNVTSTELKEHLRQCQLGRKFTELEKLKVSLARKNYWADRRGESILSSDAILERLGVQVIIDPFDIELLNPNSYNLRLGAELIEYSPTIDCFDLKKPAPPGKEITISESGYVLEPGKFYLGHTHEYTESHNLVPLLEGRSSIARMGLSVHLSAGVGDIGFCGTWTLELVAAVPVRVYPLIPICQLTYFIPHGKITKKYKGKYQGQRLPQSSKLYTELASTQRIS